MISSTRYEDSDEWQNDITREMDECLSDSDKRLVQQGYTGGTYMIFEADSPHSVTIRYPGATRGGVVIDDDCTIENIYINSGYPRQLYSKELESRLRKFIGQKLDWPEGVDRDGQ